MPYEWFALNYYTEHLTFYPVQGREYKPSSWVQCHGGYCQRWRIKHPKNKMYWTPIKNTAGNSYYCERCARKYKGSSVLRMPKDWQ